MRKQTMPRGAALIQQFIEELGGITDQQVTALLKKDAANQKYFIDYLKHSMIKEITPGVYISITNKKKYSKEMEMCAWVLLDNDDVCMEIGNKDYYISEKPAQLFFQKSNVIYNLAYIDANRKTTLELLQQLYYSRRSSKMEIDESYKYVFVISNLNDLELIKNAGLTVPFTVAYVHFEDDAMPVVEYYD